MNKKNARNKKKRECVFGLIFWGCLICFLIFPLAPRHASAELLLDSTLGVTESSFVTIDNQQMMIGEKTKFSDSQGRPVPYVDVQASSTVEAEYDTTDPSNTELLKLRVINLFYLRSLSDYNETDAVEPVSTEPIDYDLLYPTQVMVDTVQ